MEKLRERNCDIHTKICPPDVTIAKKICFHKILTPAPLFDKCPKVYCFFKASLIPTQYIFRTTSSKTGWGWGGPRTSSSYSRYNSYSGGYGRSTSSGGFGLGLGSGLLLGYSLSRPGIGYGYGWGHGHSNYQYHRAGRYDTTRLVPSIIARLLEKSSCQLSSFSRLKKNVVRKKVYF